MCPERMRYSLFVKSLYFLLILLLVIGIFFRFVNLERKIYWTDEVLTSSRISGYTKEEVIQQLYNNSVIRVNDLQKYQFPNPDKTLTDTIQALISHPEHAPLYFFLTRFWVQLFGNSVAITRSLSAFFSLLAWPCIYWLCRELFESPLVGWMAIALMTISPFHVLYAQEARPYSLWTVTILLSSWILLRALRLNTQIIWGIYAVTVALGFYTHLYFLFVSIGHGIYVIVIERFRLNKIVKSYIFTSFIGILAFTPWIWVFIQNWSKGWQSSSWLTKSLNNGIPELIFRWGRHISRVFIDFELNYNFSFENPFPYIIAVLAIVTFAGYSIYFLCRRTIKPTWLFLLTLIVIPALGTMLPDLILGGQRSGTSRYLVPCYLGIQLAVAYLLTTQIISNVNIQRQRLWQIITLVVFSIGVISCANSFPAPEWWNKSGGQRLEIAQIVNQAEKPLIINEYTWEHVISLSYLLEPKVPIQFIDRSQGISKPPDGFSDYFLYNVSQTSREELEKTYNYKSEPVVYNSKQVRLWRIEN
ncbi:MAG: glycosyltransferase family 39 protein [Prochloraceae cyanobacterium]|nr:glycosyltransferase family 39 protein [Prochloraceae cyanobacterium]